MTEAKLKVIMEVSRVVDISWLPKWIQFWAVQVWWLITWWHHYLYPGIIRAGWGKKTVIVPSYEAGKLLEKYLCLKGRK